MPVHASPLYRISQRHVPLRQSPRPEQVSCACCCGPAEAATATKSFGLHPMRFFSRDNIPPLGTEDEDVVLQQLQDEDVDHSLLQQLQQHLLVILHRDTLDTKSSQGLYCIVFESFSLLQGKYFCLLSTFSSSFFTSQSLNHYCLLLLRLYILLTGCCALYRWRPSIERRI